MGDFLSHALAGAVGYGISECRKSHELANLIDQKIAGNRNKKSLRTIIEEYAREHGIITTNDEFAYELHRIAQYYESSDYPY